MDVVILVFTVFVVGNKLVLSSLFLLRKNNSLPVKVLAIILLLPACTALSNFFMYKKLYDLVWYVQLQFVAILAMGPLTYFYIQMMLGEKVKIDLYTLAHFIPSFAAFYLLPYHYSLPQAQQKLFVDNFYGDQVWYVYWSNLILGFQYLTYAIVSAVKVHKTEKIILQFYSSESFVKIKFLKEFLYLNLILSLVALPTSVIMGNEWSDLIIVPVCMVIYTFYIYYQSMNTGAIFDKTQYNSYLENIAPMKIYREERYLHSRMSEKEVEDCFAEIEEYFAAQQPWLDSELKLTHVSKELQLSAHKVSEVINRKAGLNFNEFVNNYRLEYAKSLLENDLNKSMKMEHVGLDSGFNTKSNFYKIFKEKTGLTPSEYRKLHEISSKIRATG